MTIPKFVIKAIDRNGNEVVASDVQYDTLYRAELASLDFYGDSRFKLVWVERAGYRYSEQAA
ncbi:MAG: hypothetical protein NXI15_03765 [Gammaproteobacteria bacterium]|jgi:hypothetical protein|nr:hypothetical protein [Gammaproteobacteria bacterium]